MRTVKGFLQKYKATQLTNKQVRMCAQLRQSALTAVNIRVHIYSYTDMYLEVLAGICSYAQSTYK